MKNNIIITQELMSLMFLLFFSSLLDLDPLAATGPSAASAAPTSWGGNKLLPVELAPTTELNVLLFEHIN